MPPSCSWGSLGVQEQGFRIWNPLAALKNQPVHTNVEGPALGLVVPRWSVAFADSGDGAHVGAGEGEFESCTAYTHCQFSITVSS